MSGRLAGKRVLVTGATSGIGRAIALAMAAEGARVAVHGRRAGRAEPVVEEIRAVGGEAFAVGAELTDYPALEAMCADALERLGGIDIAVNNAGIFAEGRIRDVDSRGVGTQLRGARHRADADHALHGAGDDRAG